MKKQEIYVPIANKKEAKRAKAVLEAMGEKVSEYFYFEEATSFWFTSNNYWSCCVEGGNNYQNRTKITLKQLIELLVSEQSDNAKSTIEEKIAVRVDNEKEFNALMKYYDSLGWKLFCNSPIWSNWDGKPLCIQFNDRSETVYEKHIDKQVQFKGYKIIPFSEFAKEHGIRVPLLVSEDGVKLFEGSEYWLVKLVGDNLEFIDYKGILRNNNDVISYPERFKCFLTSQAAIDWIEAQKPKTKVVNLDNNLCFIITKDEIKIDYQLKEGNAILITNEQLMEAYKAMEELNS